MSQDVRIEKIKLTIDGKEVELTLEQARSLRDVLNEMWPPAPAPIPYPQPYPIYIEKWPEIPWWQHPITICESGVNTLCLATSSPQ